MLNVNDITNYIFVNDESCIVDAVFVVGGSLPNAAEIAAELYNNGYAKNIIIGGKYSIKRDSFPLPEYGTEFEFYKDILIKNGVNEADVYGEAFSGYTKQNAEFAKRVVDENNLSINKAIIVCKSFHARRCLLFYQMYFPDVDFKAITFDGFDVSKDNWFETDYGKKRVFGELKRIKEQVPNAENIIIDDNQLDKTAIDLLSFLIDNNMTFERAGGYWENQSYWYVKYNNEFVCYILFNGTGDEEKFSPLTVWTDDSNSNWYSECELEFSIKSIAVRHIDICEKCGACKGGITKKIFGKEYNNVCRTTFRFINPHFDELKCLKELLLMRQKDIKK
ncbi:MAG: YdcF family protein [Eubacterium sp.]